MGKVVSITDAVASIPEGAHVALSGFAISRCAMAFAHEIIRQGIKGLTVSQCVAAMDADILVGGGVVERIVYGGGSRGRFGQHHCINRGIEAGTLMAEEYSSLSMAFRHLAGSLGLPFIPIRSLRGSDTLKRLREIAPSEVDTVDDPFTGDNWVVLKPLTPDVAVVQVRLVRIEKRASVRSGDGKIRVCHERGCGRGCHSCAVPIELQDRRRAALHDVKMPAIVEGHLGRIAQLRVRER